MAFTIGGSAPTQSQARSVLAGIGAAPRAPDLVIAAADTQNKTGADILCTGTADQVAINAALLTLRGSGKTKQVLFLPGTYNLTDVITVDDSWITLEGTTYPFWNSYTQPNGNFVFPRSAVGNPGGSLFKQATSGKGAFGVGTNYYNGDIRHKGITFARLSMYSTSGTGTAIFDAVQSDVCRVYGCFIAGFLRGIDVAWDAPNIFDNNIQDLASTGDGYGIRLNGIQGHVYGNLLFQLGGQGIFINSPGACVTSNTIGLTNSNCMLITAQGVKVTGNFMAGPGGGQNPVTDGNCIAIGNFSGGATVPTTARATVITGNTLQMTKLDQTDIQSGAGNGCGVLVGIDGASPANCDNTVIVGNYISTAAAGTTATGYAVALRNASSKCVVAANSINGNWNAGSATKILAGTGTGNQIGLNAGTA